MIFPFPAGNSRRRRRLKNRKVWLPISQGFGGGQPPTSTRRGYTGALLAATCYRYVSMPQTSNGLYILNLLRSASMTPCRRSFPISADNPLRSTSR